MDKEKQTFTGEAVTKNIWHCRDGVYRWTYEMDLLRNPTILISVYKVLGLSLGVVFALDILISLFSGSLKGPEDLLGLGQLFLCLAGILLVLGIIGYLIVAALYGWKYQVLFEMTEDYVRHIHMPKQFQKAEAIGWLTALLGAAAGKPTTMGAGLLAASKSTSTSEFQNVEVVKVRRKRNTIHVNYLLDKNQVYAADEDFDFVESFILARCVKAKIK